MSRILLETDKMIYTIGNRRLIDTDPLSICDGDRIGLVGMNGAGKSTFMSILAGDLQPETGHVRRLTETAVIRQFGTVDTVEDARLRSLFSAQDGAETLSGGEKTRGRIAGALSARSALLMADEPTTDLDEKGVEELKKQLLTHRGALLLISHDRALLNEVCSRIWYLENGKITVFNGNYDAFTQELQHRRERQQFEYEQYREEEKRLRGSIQQLQERASQVKKAPSRMGNSEARLHCREWTDAVFGISHNKATLQSRLDHLEKKERPAALPKIDMTFGSTLPLQAKTVLEAQRVSLRAGTKQLITQAAFTLPTGSRTALLGENGCGKTTLLRCLLSGAENSTVRLDGKIRLHPAAKIGWFDQDHERTMDKNGSALDNVLYAAPQKETEARIILGRLNMKREDVFKPLSVLSGGERAKVAFARLLLMDTNVLVLDEPTNHLDIFTMEALEELLESYTGTLLFVSHDRTFTGRLATRLLRFENKRILTHEGTLASWEESLRQDQSKADRQLAITTLQMRMSVLAARMSAPQKGDDPLKLNADYEVLMQQLRELKNT